MLTQDRLRELVAYDRATGHFTRLIERGGRRSLGRVNAQGYLRVCVDGRLYSAHRLAWFYCFGEWPKEIDHIDGDRANNRIANLRPASRSQNIANSRRSKANTSGFKGVSRCRKKWRASIKKDGVGIHLGVFETPELAAACYADAAVRFHGEFGRAA